MSPLDVPSHILDLVLTQVLEVPSKFPLNTSQKSKVQPGQKEQLSKAEGGREQAEIRVCPDVWTLESLVHSENV